MASIDRALGHLEVEIAWVRALLRLRLRELQASGVLPGASERFPGTAISPQEVEARLREHGHARSTPPSPEEREAASQLELAGKKREEYAETHGSAGLPLLELTARLQLDPD